MDWIVPCFFFATRDAKLRLVDSLPALHGAATQHAVRGPGGDAEGARGSRRLSHLAKGPAALVGSGALVATAVSLCAAHHLLITYTRTPYTHTHLGLSEIDALMRTGIGGRQNHSEPLTVYCAPDARTGSCTGQQVPTFGWPTTQSSAAYSPLIPEPLVDWRQNRPTSRLMGCYI
ncbi:hypothetical protein IF2G_08759 [Cordyceps javanica]|nr:hypothetical protein IF2G_08759 [Cordyceps javanica]